ncbi:MAG TPA: MG2 domain-containing protein, partial [Phycisphaerae bacterium]|nr:MG2 domain-containing protein [Phycisphaerae bacterium]
MARLPLRFAVFAALLLVLNSVGLFLIYSALADDAVPRVRILSVAPAKDADMADRFTLIFDGPLATPGAVGTAATDALYEITPAPDGHWTWAAPDRLEYLLDRPLPPGREFTLRPVSDFFARTRRTLVGESLFRVQTRALMLVSCVLDSADRYHANVLLTFNQPVLPADLMRHLEMTPIDADGESVVPTMGLSPTCLTQEPADRLTIRVDRWDTDHAKLKLDAALCGAGGERPLGEDVTRQLTLAPAFSLERADAYDPELDRDTTVTLDFTESLDLDQAPPTVTLEPDVPGVRMRLRWDEIRLTGPFKPRQRYRATVAANLLSDSGRPLGEAQTISFEIPDYNPQISLADDRGILSPRGNLLLDARVVNVAGIEVSAARVHANNLVAHLRGDSWKGTARDLPTRTFAVTGPRNEPQTVALDLHSLLNEPQGVYYLAIAATDRTWTSDRAVITVTDLAITSKRERDSLWVWVTSLRSAQPVADVQVRAWSYNNQVLATATTDADGAARLTPTAADPDGGVWVVTAERDGDLAYLQPDERVWVLDDVDQSGRRLPEHYDVMLYPERGVYRPGDVIHVAGIIRDRLGGVPNAFPLAIAVRQPDGQKTRTLTVTPQADAGGTFQFDFPTTADGQLGSYAFTATLPGDDDVLGATDALVESFLPARIEFTADASQPLYVGKAEPEVAVSGQYLIGKPAADLPVEVTGAYQAAAFTSERFRDFTFGLTPDRERHAVDDVEAELAANGTATLTLAGPPADLANPGVWLGRFAATVSEAGGRSVSHNVTVRVDPVDRHIGLRAAGSFVPVGDPVEVTWVQVDAKDDLAAPADMTCTLERIDHSWAIRTVNGRRTWQSEERRTQVWRQQVEADAEPGPASLSITCPDAGTYVLTAKVEGTAVASALTLHAIDDPDGADRVAVEQPERVEIEFERERSAPGSDAVAHLRLPFAGTVLLTLETDAVAWHEVLAAADTSLTVHVPVPADLRGGAFLSAELVRAVDPLADDWLPHRAMGLARLTVDHAAQQLEVAIDAPADAEPGTTVPVTVRCTQPVSTNALRFVHVWAVDDGILLTTNYAVPDAWQHFLAPPAAAVETADVFADLLPDQQRPVGMTRIGADDDYLADTASLLAGPVESRRRQAAVVWNAFVPAGPDGGATVAMTM